jgi:hypothetical protein
MSIRSIFCFTVAGLLLAGAGALAQQPERPRRQRPARERVIPPVIGRWDLTVQSGEGTYPSWLELQLSGYKTLVGYFVHRGGSVRPISRVEFEKGRVRFTLPVQWEQGSHDLAFEGQLSGDRLSGTMTDDEGRRHTWTGVRAPKLKRTSEPHWGEPIELFNGRDLSGWRPRNPNKPNGWRVVNGILSNQKPGNDLVTERAFDDFKLHAEFRYPKGSNSGIYLRGRYEVQVEDDYGREPDSHGIGGVYGFLTPRINAAKPAGEWQTFDLTLIGRQLTVEHNGELVIDRQEIPGITGGALDSNEGAPGPIFIQGDHGVVELRKMTITPAR